MARRRTYIFTSRRRAALRRASQKSAKKRKQQKSSDTIGYYMRQLPGMVANAATMGQATKISGIVERKDQQHRRRHMRYRVR